MYMHKNWGRAGQSSQSTHNFTDIAGLALCPYMTSSHPLTSINPLCMWILHRLTLITVTLHPLTLKAQELTIHKE